MNRVDSIIIGAGHNGLVCAAYLARAGQRVLVLEASNNAGGLAARREFHPGFRVSAAHSVGHFSQKIAKDLELASHGLESSSSPLATIGLATDGDHVILHESSLSGVAPADAAAWDDYSRMMRRFAAALNPFWLKTIPGIGASSRGAALTFAHVGLNLRRMGKVHMREFLRVFPLPARDLMDEFFDDELLKATLSWDSLIGSRVAPRSPNGAVFALLYRMAGNTGSSHRIPAGGIAQLVDALASSATASGAEIRCSARVDRILIDGSTDGLSAKGVRLADGETYEADRVVSGADPKLTFLRLVGVEHLDIGFTNRIRRLRCDGYVGKLHLALNGVPEFRGLERPDGRMIIAPSLDAIEFAYDQAKYGECPAEPMMEIVLPSVHDASPAANGQHVLSAHVMYVPYRLRGGWTDAARDQVRERSIDVIARYAPGIREQIVHSEFLTPPDLEREFHVSGGHWHHGDLSIDQSLMMRPTYEAAQYSTPIPGLYLCSAGCHPGGDITGAAGHNAAREILR